MQTNKIIYGFCLLAFAVLTVKNATAQSTGNGVDEGQRERQYCIEVLTKIADPVLNALSKNELKLRMPVESIHFLAGRVTGR